VVVHALEREVADVVQRLDVGERSRRVALLALRAVLALVDLRLGMAAEAARRPRLERDRRMAVDAADFQVLAVEVERRLLVVVEDVVAGLDVAALALVAEPAFVRVVLGVTAFGRAVRFRRGEVALGMAVSALVLLVLAAQRPLADLALGVLRERLVVIELDGPVARRLVTVVVVAALAERALVQRVLV